MLHRVTLRSNLFTAVVVFFFLQVKKIGSDRAILTDLDRANTMYTNGHVTGIFVRI